MFCSQFSSVFPKYKFNIYIYMYLAIMEHCNYLCLMFWLKTVSTNFVFQEFSWNIYSTADK